MIPIRRSGSRSRRSSILKPPKQRQPLQCVVINPPSSESSSDVKTVKRRVSFAEKKHVKKFCDSFEQGTVWDSTYEESESSNQKTNHSENRDEGSSTSRDTNPILPSSIISLDKENVPLDIQIFKDQPQLNPPSEVAPITPFFDDPEPKIQSEVLASSAMETDSDLPDVLTYTNELQNFNNIPNQETASQEKNSCYNSPCAEENISTNIFKSALQNTIYNEETMVFTKMLPSRPQNDKENSYSQPNAEEQTERVIHNLSMDFTEAVPNALYSEMNERENEDGMDLTLGRDNEIQKPIDGTLMNDISMDLTTAIPSLRTKIFDNVNNDNADSEVDNFTTKNVSMEMTSAVPSIPIISQGNLVQIQRDERTRLFRNSMEFTAAVPSCYAQDPLKSVETNTIGVLSRQRSMEFTSVVPSILSSVNQENLQKRTTETDRNESMELTTFVPSNLPEQNKSLPGKSMEFTAAVPSIFSSVNQANFQKKTTETARNESMEFTCFIPSNLPERTENLRGKSMEFTAVVPSNLTEQNKTLRGKSMEFTAVVPSNLPEQNKTLRGKSMEFTAVVPSNLPEQNKTLRGKSMEFTAVVPNCFPEENVQSRDLEDKSVRLFPYKSMEFKTIPSSLPEKSSSNSPDLSTTEKKIGLSILGESAETRSLTLENQSNFENCSHVGVKQMLRRSDGIGVLNMELTEPILLPHKDETLEESVLKPSSVEKNLMSDFQKISLVADASLSQIFMPPLSTNLSLEKSANLEAAEHSRSKSLELNAEVDISKEVFNLSKGVQISEEREDEAKEENLEPTEHSRSKSLELNAEVDISKEVFNLSKEVQISEETEDEAKEVNLEASEHSRSKSFELNAEVDVSKEVFNLSKGVQISEEREDEAKEANLETAEHSRSKSLELNAEVDISKEVFNLSKGVQISEEREDKAKEVEQETENVGNESEERLKSFCLSLNNKNIENEEPPSFFNTSLSEENSLEEFGAQDQEAFENQNEDLSGALKIGSKRSFETSGICQTENQVEISIKRRSIENTESPQQLTENPIIFNENSKNGQDRRYTFVISQETTAPLDNSEKGIEFQDLGDEIKKKGKKRNSGGQIIDVSENAIISNENSKKEQDRRYTFVIQKEMDLNLQNEIRTEETVLEKNSNENENLSFGETVTIKGNSSMIVDEEEMQTKEEIKDCQTEELINNDVEMFIVAKQNDSTIIKDPFSTLLDDIRHYAERDECIWDVRLLNEKMLALNFVSKSLVVIIELYGQSEASFRDIKNIKLKSLLPEETQPLIRIVHDLILHKIRPEVLLESYKLYEDVMPMLDQISTEIKLSLEFMFELQRLRDINLMEIDSKRISFVTCTRRMTIILEITLNIKPFEELNTDDVNIKCILGSISISKVKQLIVNVRKDHKFLRRFMDDVKDYVELMEDYAAAGRKVVR